MEKKEFILLLRDYVKGKISKYELIDGDPNVYDVKEDKSNRGSSIIKLEFEGDSFLKMLGLSDVDIWFYQAINSPYSSFQVYERSNFEDDFYHGFGAWNFFDGENEELLKEIAKYGFNISLDIDDIKSRDKFASFLGTTFPKEIDSILDDFTSEMNSAASIAAQEFMDEELKGVFKDTGFEMINDNTISITVGELIFLYFENDKLDDPVKKLLSNIFSSEKHHIGGWYEDSYSLYDNENFDKDSFNRSANWQLEKIYDTIMDDEEQVIKSYIRLVNELTKKYNFGVSYDLPKNKNYHFAIAEIDKETLKIVVYLTRKRDGVGKKVTLSEENFNNLLYQPELFNFDELYNF